MEARELRIGNYIQSGIDGIYNPELGLIGKVLEIGNEERDFEQVYCECEESFEWFFRDNYFGILLTEEWLLKFGFNNTMAGIPSFHNGMFGLFWENGSLFLLTQGVCLEIPYIKSVHHLQNLIFALTGEELTIKQSQL